jgi:hypothetical protein
MTVLHVTARVPESRQVTLTLPPDTPVGAEVEVVVRRPAGEVVHYRPPDPAEAAEFDAFLRLLPDLRPTHAHQYVAVSGGRVVAAGPHLGTVRAAAGGAAYYCGWVEPVGGYVPRSGKVVVAPPAGDGS